MARAHHAATGPPRQDCYSPDRVPRTPAPCHRYRSDGPVSDCGRYDWERLVRRIDVNPSVKLVALTVATYADRSGGNIFPGVQRLAAVTGLTDKTVRAGLKRLRELGLLDRTREGSRRGRQGLADEYQLAYPADLWDRVGGLDPEESPELSSPDPVVTTADHRNSVPGSPVMSSGTPELSSPITGNEFPPPSHTTPDTRPPTNVRLGLGTELTTARGGERHNVIDLSERWGA